MKFLPTPLAGAWLVELERREEERGFFARTFCAEEFQATGLASSFVQCNISFNVQRGTLRGLHYQKSPAAEAKLVRCTAGGILDVIVDLRPDSSSYLQHFAVELNARNRLALYVPEGFAHGFQTLEDQTEVFYQMSTFYVPTLASGIRPSDPKLAIAWPLPVSRISEKDQQWPLLS